MVDQALSLHTRHEVFVVGASRTDAGVHARGQVAHFDLPIELLEARPEIWQADWEAKVNACLPNDIRVRSFEDVPPSFHSTFSAIGKTYVYRLHAGPEPIDPTDRLYRHVLDESWSTSLDSERVREIAAKFVGEHDFALFSKKDLGRPNLTTIRTIHGINVVDEGAGRWRFEVNLSGALWRMVRNVVGCILASASNRFPIDAIDELLAGQSYRGKGGSMVDPRIASLPGKGLCLERIYYKPDSAEWMSERT